MVEKKINDIVIVGAGPAGLTASIYAARAGLSAVVLDELGAGGQLLSIDEPTIGLHPRDVQTLLQVFDALIAKGATVVVIEHDLDVIRSADCVIDMGPGGGEEGGRIVACGTPEDIRNCPESVTGKFI